MRSRAALAGLVTAAATASGALAQGNRLAHLGSHDPYYLGRGFARLATPQWVGEAGVEAVAILSIDDLRAPEPYEAFLRPVLERLKEIDGHAPVSVMVNALAPDHAIVARWLAEGLSLETHTEAHPCPLLAGGDLAAARATYESCIENIAAAAKTAPVAFRMPCCDSIDSVSPRFFAEIFEQTSPSGAFLALDSSVFQLFTPDEPSHPRELVLDARGEERFRPYLPADRSFANWIEDHPFPYVIGSSVWEFPCTVPSDWQGQHRFEPNDPRTLEDLKAALDLCVRAQGVFTLVFHPHGWIRNDQVVELVDHATERHGRGLRFLTLREALARLEANVLVGQPLRRADGTWNGVLLLDLDGDRYQDVVIGNEQMLRTRRWRPGEQGWEESDFPLPLVQQDERAQWIETGARFGVSRDDRAWLLACTETSRAAWRFDGERWVEAPERLRGLEIDGEPLLTARRGRDFGVRMRDIDGDGECEVLAASPRGSAVFRWDAVAARWAPLPFGFPPGIPIVDGEGRDAGLRFVDLDDDGREDLVASNERGSSVHLFASLATGWSRKGLAAAAGDPGRLPPITERGREAGAWFHSRRMWVQNEHTATLPNHVEQRAFRELVAGAERGPRNVEHARRAQHPPPRFVVELAACEPEVQDPIAFDWDARGRLFVVEMADYPTGERGGGRVKLLEDEDGDGRYESATLFLDDLAFPTGVTPWRDGVLVTCAPDILFARDTDGDGVADERQALYTGFVEGNPQHRVNGLWWGLDGWYWGANGDSGGEIVSVKTGERADIGGRDFRIHPASGRIEAVTGMTQFGRTRDDWGNWFGGHNSEPFRHYLLEERYLARVPLLDLPPPRVDVTVESGAAPVFPLSPQEDRFNDLWALDRFTSACSPSIYRDELLGPAYAGNVFVCEPVHNLVHREVIERAGASFRSRRAPSEARSEFLASSDPWFRPTMVRAGPDGALWIADMARAVIEHPEWIPDDWEARIDLYEGSELGRIWRVLPRGTEPRPIPDLAAQPSSELVRALGSPSGWVRDCAQRLLVERADASVAPELAVLARGGESALARLHALCALEGLGRLDPELVRAALHDPEAGVRANALRLAEPFLAIDGDLTAAAAEVVDDPDPGVRLQLAFSLGAADSPAASRALAGLLQRSADDPHLHAAAASSLSPALLAPVAGVLLDGDASLDVAVARTLVVVATLRREAGVLNATLSAFGEGSWAPRLELFAAFFETGDRFGLSIVDLLALLDTAGAELLEESFGYARVLVANVEEAAEVPVAVPGLLGRDQNAWIVEHDVELLGTLLSPDRSADLARAALRALDRIDHPAVAVRLLESFDGFSPALRSEVITVLLHRVDRATALAGALEAGRIAPVALDAAQRARLLEILDDDRRARLSRFLVPGAVTARSGVLERYCLAVASLTGDADAGRERFVERCAACHLVAGVGRSVGADLDAFDDLSDAALLEAVLDPNRAVEARYLSYTLVTTGGEMFGGLVQEERSHDLVLVDSSGQARTFLRTEISDLRSSGLSFMPSGLENDLSPQDLADVFAFLRRARPRR